MTIYLGGKYMAKTQRITIRLDEVTFNRLNELVAHFPDSDMSKVIVNLINSEYLRVNSDWTQYEQIGKGLNECMNLLKQLPISKMFNDK